MLSAGRVQYANSADRGRDAAAGAVRFAAALNAMHFSARLASNGQGFVFCPDMRRERVPPPTRRPLCAAWVNGALLADAFVFFVLNDSEGIEVLEKSGAPGK
jgi:hypothetical protein